jgi:hypothetical protein
MKGLLFFIITFFAFFSASASKVEILSLNVYTEKSETAFPLLDFTDGENNRLIIEFDINAAFEPNMQIIFRFCDKNWNPYQNIFLQNFGRNTDHNLTFDYLPANIQRAKYHFKNYYPDRNGNVTFPFSGKWKFFITDTQDTSIVYGSGKFIVVYNEIPLDVTIRRETLEDKVYFPVDLGRVFNFATRFYLGEPFFPLYVDRVEILENRKTEFIYIVDRTTETSTRYYNWNADRQFSFTIKDILPGNSYRQTDLRNINRFIGPVVNAQIDGIETTRFYSNPGKDLNGGFILTPFKNEFADYLNVNFKLRPPDEIYKDVFITGAFNNWRVTPEYKMNNEYGLRTIILELKRGIYDYQYVTGTIKNNIVTDINWISLEGNNQNTSNMYYIFLYYKDQDLGGYDRIIGYRTITSR